MLKNKISVAILYDYLSHVSGKNFTDILKGTILSIERLYACID